MYEVENFAREVCNISYSVRSVGVQTSIKGLKTCQTRINLYYNLYTYYQTNINIYEVWIPARIYCKIAHVYITTVWM